MNFARAILRLFVLVPLVASPAHADVLEIAPGGEAVWVSGPEMTAPHSTPQGVYGAANPVEPPSVVPSRQRTAAAGTAHQAAGIPLQYSAVIAQLSVLYDLPPALIEALVWQESRWQENAVSPAGARGLTQLMPATARELGVNPDDPIANLTGGARYLRQQLNRFNGDLGRALAAYNAGPGRVISAGGIPRIRETQNYVASIIGRLSRHARSSQ